METDWKEELKVKWKSILELGFVVHAEKERKPETTELTIETYFWLENFIEKLLHSQIETLVDAKSVLAEKIAEAIYDQMFYTENGVKPSWTLNGNSMKQDEARAIARKLLSEVQAVLTAQINTPRNK